MVFLASYFFLNLFCGFFSCDYNYDLHSGAQPRTASRTDRIRGVRGSNPLLVETQSGAIEGFSMRTAEQREIHAFEGVPYGEAPVGNLRFRSPRPKLSWRGVRDAKAPGPYCPQTRMEHIPRIFGAEDCLFLNVYTPNIDEKTKAGMASLPVIIFFHGGAFKISGSQDYGPAYLLDQDIVFVTVNFRLGLLGFLSTSDEASPGNFGLKDQALAMRWVNQNIAKFGGNSSQVTLFGSSSGGSSVHLHMLSNKTREYFSAGISASGTAFSSWVFPPERLRKQTNDRLAKMTRCPLAGKSSEEFVDCLRKINVHTLVGKHAFLYDEPQLPSVLFGPVVESPTPEAFLTETPQEIYRQNKAAKYPWITTLAKDECDIFVIFLQSFGMFRPMLNKWTNSSALILDYKYEDITLKRRREITKMISHNYFSTERPNLDDAQILAQAMSDRSFNFPAHQAVIAHSQVAPTFAGIFGYKGARRSVVGLFNQDKDKWGVVHGEEEFYYFNRSAFYQTLKPSEDPDYTISKLLTTMVANFAKTREPVWVNDFEGTGTGSSAVRVWESVDPEIAAAADDDDESRPIRYLFIDKQVKMMDEPHRHRFQFWKALNLQ